MAGDFEDYLSRQAGMRILTGSRSTSSRLREGNEESLIAVLSLTRPRSPGIRLRESGPANCSGAARWRRAKPSQACRGRWEWQWPNGNGNGNGGAKADGNGVTRRARSPSKIHEAKSIGKLLRRTRRARACRSSISLRPGQSVVRGASTGDGAKPPSAIPVFSVFRKSSRHGDGNRKAGHVQLQRFKGLGEMNAKELFTTTMDPENSESCFASRWTRRTQVEADRIFTILMGDVVEPRRQFIEDNALSVRNLDI